MSFDCYSMASSNGTVSFTVIFNITQYQGQDLAGKDLVNKNVRFRGTRACNCSQCKSGGTNGTIGNQLFYLAIGIVIIVIVGVILTIVVCQCVLVSSWWKGRREDDIE